MFRLVENCIRAFSELNILCYIPLNLLGRGLRQQSSPDEIKEPKGIKPPSTSHKLMVYELDRKFIR